MTESSWVINFQRKMLNSKKRKCKENQRRWTKEEIEKFSEILADPTNNYAASLEMLVSKSRPIMNYLNLLKTPLIKN